MEHETTAPAPFLLLQSPLSRLFLPPSLLQLSFFIAVSDCLHLPSSALLYSHFTHHLLSSSCPGENSETQSFYPFSKGQVLPSSCPGMCNDYFQAGRGNKCVCACVCMLQSYYADCRSSTWQGRASTSAFWDRVNEDKGVKRRGKRDQYNPSPHPTPPVSHKSKTKNPKITTYLA